MSKHIILVHGFLLSGTGSNIYCFNLAQTWKKQGHAVTIFCQDPDAGSYDWVDEFYQAHVSIANNRFTWFEPNSFQL